MTGVPSAPSGASVRGYPTPWSVKPSSRPYFSTYREYRTVVSSDVQSGLGDGGKGPVRSFCTFLRVVDSVIPLCLVLVKFG